MKLLETILLALAVVCFIVGVHQTFSYGFTNSYSFFMLMISFFMSYGIIKVKRMEKEKADGDVPKDSKKK
jgi:ABC-type multidrug transport system permease subunit